MKIKTMLYSSIMASMIAFLATGAICLIAFHRINMESANVQRASELARKVFEANLILHEYLIHREQRPLVQWKLQSNRISGSFQQMLFLKPENQTLLDEIKDNYEAIKSSFFSLVSTNSTSIPGLSPALIRQKENRLQSRILVKTHDIFNNAIHIARASEDYLLSSQKTALWGVLAAIFFLSLVSVGLSAFTARSILQPLNRLRKGTDVIAKGNLYYHVETKSDNEIGQLTGAFNQMINDLKAVMISKDELEQVVSRRTTKLSEINVQLQKEIAERKQSESKLKDAYAEIKHLKDFLEQENIYLREEIEVNYKHEEIIGKSKPIMEMLSRSEQVAETDSTVLILGETGTGKDLLARSIHKLSSRQNRQMVKVNCAALPVTLIESELFGRERGAYTGAMTRQIGRFEIADGSTIFLDEIGELPLEVQTKLLRVLQEGQFERLGNPQTISVNVRIIASTNRDLARAIAESRFREDLYYRLNVFSITVPPLRDRIEDIPLLVWTLVKEFEKSMGKAIEKIPQKSIDALQQYPWPGNIRELRNIVENAMIMSKGKILKLVPPVESSLHVPRDLNLEVVERNHIIAVLEKTSWRVSGEKGAAKLLGLKPTTLESRMKKLGVTRSR